VTSTLIDITGVVVPVDIPAACGPIPASHPHVTLLAPFRARPRLDAELCRELTAFFATQRAFTMVFVAERTFAGGPRYLAPEPAERIVAMTDALAVRYPDTPPYEGQFRDIVPHCTLDLDGPAPPLPISLPVTEAHLVHSLGDTWDVIARFAFATQ
jgi:hypothetical protein